jgi:Zn-dependent peptidase ImmA (M78 family)
MRLAADALLAIYAGASKNSSLPIAVEQLCRLCGAELLGTRPFARKSDAYSTDDYKTRTGHTGKVYFRDSKVIVKIPETVGHGTARVSVAHEVAHLLIHRRGDSYDEATIRLPSTPEEEALAEYGARLLLMPSNLWPPVSSHDNLAEFALILSSQTRVTIHSVVARMGDPDVIPLEIRGAILWRINREISRSHPIAKRLMPQWHLCPGAFVPVRRCTAKTSSLIAELGRASSPVAGSRVEDVSIGSFTGLFRVDAFGWGSVEEGTRLVLSIFRE